MWPFPRKSPQLETRHSGFTAEAPIKSVKDDLLGRKDFAGSIATVLRRWSADHSLVIALRGHWGTGKTSLKNMIVENLTQGRDGPEILEFNPWQYDETAAITAAFYREVGKAIGKTRDPLSNWAFRHVVRRYAAFFSSATSPLQKGSKKVTAVLGWFGALGVAGAGLAQLIPAPWLHGAPTGLMLLAAASWILSKVLEMLAGPILPDKPIRVVRQELERHLRKRKRSLVVIIDDIDRLDAEGIRLIFRHVKVNADLPNISYLLLFQRSIVEAALNFISGNAGRQYLEKIVQASFEIPAVEPARIEGVLTNTLDQMFSGKLTPENGFDQERWGNLFYGAMRNYFRTLRDVHRYISSLTVLAALHDGDEIFEVNVIDLMGIEAVRIFEPDMYEGISQNKALLTSTREGRGDEERDAVLSLLSTIPEERRDGARQFLRQLFPTVEWALPHGMGYGPEFIAGWAAEKRICARRMFDRYFSLRLPDATISESEYMRFIRQSASFEDTLANFESFKVRGLLPIILERLDEARSSLPVENISSLARALFDIGDHFDNENASAGTRPFLAAWRSAYWYFLQIPEEQPRGQMFLEVLANSTGLSVPKTLISNELGRDDRESERLRRRLLTSEQLEQAKAIWVEKLRALVTNPDRVLEHPQFLSYIYQWVKFENQPAVDDWFRRVTADPRDLLVMLKHFESNVHRQTVGSFVGRTITQISIRDLRQFFDLANLSNRLESIVNGRFSEEERFKAREYNIHIREELERAAQGPINTGSDEVGN